MPVLQHRHWYPTTSAAKVRGRPPDTSESSRIPQVAAQRACVRSVRVGTQETGNPHPHAPQGSEGALARGCGQVLYREYIRAGLITEAIS
jgi:hypothetical protein